MMVANNLPLQPTSFVGREKELADIAALLADPNCRLLSLVGAGGIGKTRLALQVAPDQLPHFADGVYFIPLAPITSPSLLPAAIASALGITFYEVDESRIQLARYLCEKQMLLLMDNFEHLLDGAELVTELLQAAPRLKILATSRERLNLQEEWGFVLDGLSYPTTASVGSLETYSAVQLFVQRARQMNNHFSLNENPSAVQSICRQLEGMPLGLELAATWLRVMSCQQIEARMASNPDFLTSPFRNLPERHRSLRAVFTQSWNLLSSDEQAVLMKLSVFRGGFDLEAAEQVAGATLPLLAELADKSLIRLNASGRYDLHELLRQFAADQLLDADMTTITIQRHIDYFLNLAKESEAHEFGRDQIAWFDRLEVEFDNIRAALARSAESETGLRLAAALGWFFSERAHFNEGLDWLERMLTANPDAPPSLHAKALHTAGVLAWYMGNGQRTRTLCEQALAVARTANDRWNMAWSLGHLGNYVQENLDQRAAILEESLALFRELDDAMGITHVLVRQAWAAMDQGDYPYARTLLEEAENRARQAGDKVIIAWITHNKGCLAWNRDQDLIQAKRHIESSLSLFQEVRLQIGVKSALGWLAGLELELGNIMEAQARIREFLSLREIEPSDPYLPSNLVISARIASAQGQFERAARLLGATNSIMLALKRDTSDLPNFDRDVAALREQLGAAAFAAAWSKGHDMTPKQLITYALENSPLPSETLPSVDTADQPLTDRELEVLHLIADGLNSREIAQQLVLSVGTIRWYLKLIYSKLDAHSRSEALARAKSLNILT